MIINFRIPFRFRSFQFVEFWMNFAEEKKKTTINRRRFVYSTFLCYLVVFIIAQNQLMRMKSSIQKRNATKRGPMKQWKLKRFQIRKTHVEYVGIDQYAEDQQFAENVSSDFSWDFHHNQCWLENLRAISSE